VLPTGLPSVIKGLSILPSILASMCQGLTNHPFTNDQIVRRED